MLEIYRAQNSAISRGYFNHNYGCPDRSLTNPSLPAYAAFRKITQRNTIRTRIFSLLPKQKILVVVRGGDI